jgi:outer membrane receptor protein involved in Fe transport
MFHYESRIAPGATPTEFVSTPGSPIRLRGRATATWTYHDLAVTSAFNYTAAYSNRGTYDLFTGLPLPATDIASWFTLDMGIGYNPKSAPAGAWQHGFSASLHILNLFDKDPPYYNDGVYGLGYDPSNANPIGRKILLTVSKSW